MDELKPCPFCGAKAQLHSYVQDGYLPECTSCDGMIERWFYDRQEAINVWNKRQTKSKKEIIDKINEFYKHDITNLRNIGFVDGLRWVIEELEETE